MSDSWPENVCLHIPSLMSHSCKNMKNRFIIWNYKLTTIWAILLPQYNQYYCPSTTNTIAPSTRSTSFSTSAALIQKRADKSYKTTSEIIRLAKTYKVTQASRRYEHVPLGEKETEYGIFFIWISAWRTQQFFFHPDSSTAFAYKQLIRSWYKCWKKSKFFKDKCHSPLCLFMLMQRPPHQGFSFPMISPDTFSCLIMMATMAERVGWGGVDCHVWRILENGSPFSITYTDPMAIKACEQAFWSNSAPPPLKHLYSNQCTL